ncbi:MAG: sulfatase-like hydrolase/transferase, partial [Deltaproteobacteria bacterium]|nr:sulfatase-like hydrolase/transferase [Deltaproteobacteria bacterium]
YDNTVLQTDDLLGRLIDMLRDRLAVLIYASDHGESLGEGGEVMHGGEGKAEHWRIPFFIWHSDAYARQYPEIVAGLRDHVGQSISHDHLYHTVIGLGGLRSAGVDPELDLTNRAGLSKEVKASR